MSPAISSVSACADAEELARRAADYFQAAVEQDVLRQGVCRVALAGGSTPQRLYTLLARRPLSLRGVHLFWGDERCVPPDHPDSNYGLVQRSWLQWVEIPPQQVHRMPGELPPAQGAAAYTAELRAHWGAIPWPSFDLVLLGVGEDGHTASLFPGSPALEESQAWVLAVPHRQPPPPLVDRLSLSLPVLNAARRVLFLVSGANKAPILRRLFAPTPEEAAAEPLPAARVQPTAGRLTWLVEAAALGELPGG